MSEKKKKKERGERYASSVDLYNVYMAVHRGETRYYFANECTCEVLDGMRLLQQRVAPVIFHLEVLASRLFQTFVTLTDAIQRLSKFATYEISIIATENRNS